MLWGAHAQAKAALVRRRVDRHLVLQCNHPSPLSATRGPVPFIGCGHFGLAQRASSRPPNRARRRRTGGWICPRRAAAGE